jgi:hypothetical protein
MCTRTFGWLASKEHHHDEDAKQLSLLLRYTLLKCVTSVVFILATPQEFTLVRWNVAAIKAMLWADAVVGPFMRRVLGGATKPLPIEQPAHVDLFHLQLVSTDRNSMIS